VVFSESTSFGQDARERAKQYSLIVAGSTWNRDVLIANGINPVAVVMQGVDTTYFHPAPRLGVFQNRFVVFSGGKLESRKGQDLVVQSFRIFARNHPEALLVTAWSSPWPKWALTLSKNTKLVPIQFDSDGAPNVLRWTTDNGISAEQVFHLGPVPHMHLPRIIREANVALFPNRAEGGTNLVAMECMACGVPVILSANTGHLDLIQHENCFVLEHQEEVDEPGCDGWGKSDVDEIVAVLETAYANKEDAASRGRRGSTFISKFTWGVQMAQLAEVLHPFANG
jgi:glycosyltransferase involved in cell wall biosynthesis